MIKLLESKIVTLPKVYFITDRQEIKKIPIGIPYIYGDESVEKHLIRILEYEVLYQSAKRSGYKFNFRKILEEKGFKDLEKFHFERPVYMDYVTEGNINDDPECKELKSLKEQQLELKDYIRDSSVYVDIEKLKNLKVFPIWLDTVEKSISTNIHNYSLYNPNMYNKKLDGMYGGIVLSNPKRNLFNIDISGSIPKGASSNTLAMVKNMAESFYADVLITGSKTTLYPYELLHELNIETIYTENGMGNDQTWFRRLVSSEVREYNTVIVFGDNHHPGYPWSNEYNSENKSISDEDGKKLCKWRVDKIISFHTTSNTELAGYARWFDTKNIEYIKDWVKYLED